MIAASGSAPKAGLLLVIAALRGCRSTPKAWLLCVRRRARIAKAKAFLLSLLLLLQVPPTILVQELSAATAPPLLPRRAAPNRANFPLSGGGNAGQNSQKLPGHTPSKRPRVPPNLMNPGSEMTHGKALFRP